MELGRLLRWLPVLALVACGSTACKGKGKDRGDDRKPAAAAAAGAAGAAQRCDQLAQACGDNDKHVQKIAEECKQDAAQEAGSGCLDKVVAAYDCYQRELCGKGEPVWSLDDLRVLSDRHQKCLAERSAIVGCGGK